MIKKLRVLDDHTLVAEGLKFDLGKVLETSLPALRVLIRRTGMRFPGQGPTTFQAEEDEAPRLLDDAGWEEIEEMFRESKREAYDVADFFYTVFFGPFAAHLYLLGFEALHGPHVNCVTSYGQNWEDLDTSPLILIRMRDGAECPIDDESLVFLRRTLEPLREKGVTFEPWTRLELHFFGLHFPHAAFGAGDGRIRICRYLEVEDMDGEES